LTPAQEALVSSAAKKKLKDAEEAYDVLYGDTYLKITYISTGKVTKGEKGDLVIKTSGDLDKLIKILINGKELDAINYKLEKGSTIFTLKESYLKNLDPGKYKVTFVYTTGKSVDASFTIEGSTKGTEEGKAVPVNDKVISPKTGDNVLIYVFMFGLGMLGLAGLGYCRYKKKK
jgi:LPXTG-motif cell wall-anchored protein